MIFFSTVIAYSFVSCRFIWFFVRNGWVRVRSYRLFLLASVRVLWSLSNRLVFLVIAVICTGFTIWILRFLCVFMIVCCSRLPACSPAICSIGLHQEHDQHWPYQFPASNTDPYLATSSHSPFSCHPFLPPTSYTPSPLVPYSPAPVLSYTQFLPIS